MATEPPTASRPPPSPDAMGELFASMRARGHNDAAFCVAEAAVETLGEGTPAPLQDFVTRFRPARPRRPTRALTAAEWLRHVYHSDDDPYVGKVFEAVLGPLRRARTQGLSRFGLSAADAHDPATSSVAVVRALGGAAYALGVPTPQIYVRPEQPGGIASLPSEPIASVVGAAFATGCPLDELAFAAGCHLSLYRPDHYVRVLFASAQELTTIFLAALKIGERALDVPETVERFVEQLEWLVGESADDAALLRRVAALFLDRGVRADIARWMSGVELTGLRAGLLLGGSVGAARGAFARGGGVTEHAFSDLVQFALSTDYFALRQALGLALWPNEAPRTGRLSVPPPVPHGPPTIPPPSALPRVAPLGDRGRVARSLSELPGRPSMRGGTLMGLADPALLPARVSLVPPAPVAGVGGSEHPLAERFERCLASGETGPAYYLGSVWMRREGSLVPSLVRELVAREAHRASARPIASLTDAHWHELLADRGEHTPVGRVLARLEPILLLAQPRSPEDFGYDRRTALDRQTAAAGSLLAATEALSAPTPYVFAAPDYPAAFARPPTDPPTTLVNPVRLAKFSPLELMFVAAEHVAYNRSERRARVLARSPALLAAALRTVVAALRGTSGPSDDAALLAAVAAIGARAPAHEDALRRAVAQLQDVQDLDAQVIAWCEATERTAARAGFLLACDFETAATALGRQRGAPALLPAEAKLAALENFASSPAFATLRSALGL